MKKAMGIVIGIVAFAVAAAGAVVGIKAFLDYKKKKQDEDDFWDYSDCEECCCDEDYAEETDESEEVDLSENVIEDQPE